jgi:hypothetical protein
LAAHLHINEVELVLDEKSQGRDVGAKLRIAVNNNHFGHGRPKVDFGLVANFAAFINESLHALHAQLKRKNLSSLTRK